MSGHLIGLNLKRSGEYAEGEAAPITIDGASFRHVGEIRVDASPSGAMTVTVTFHAREIRGAEENVDNWIAPEVTE